MYSNYRFGSRTMKNKILDYGVFIGRFSPLHREHLKVILNALSHCNRLIICIGTSNSPRTIKNPWTASERMVMIQNSLPEEIKSRVLFQFIEDRLYQNQEWANLVRAGVRAVLLDSYAGNYKNCKIGLVCAEKDDTSWYINLFKDWEKIRMNVDISENALPISSTKIRELIFTGHIDYIDHIVPPAVYSYIKEFVKTYIFSNLFNEYNDAIAYEKLYENHPKGHSINFYTSDCVVIQSGHILLVERGKNPGKGLWALPGGHVGPNETAQDGALRELIEETNIKVPKKVLIGSLRASQVFDHPDRSMRARITKKNARTITTAFLFKLNDNEDLPRVKAADDASSAYWFPIETVLNTMRDKLFEDHIDIIHAMLGKLND